MVKARVGSGEPVVPEGRYQAQFGGIEDYGEGTYGPMWNWLWYVAHNGAWVRVPTLSSQSFTPRSKAYRWASALLGRKPEEGEEIDFDALRGTECVADVEVNDNGFAKVENIWQAGQPQQMSTESPPQAEAPPASAPAPAAQPASPAAQPSPGGWTPPDEVPF